MGEAIAAIKPLVNEEQWQAVNRLTTIPVGGLIKRSLRRIDLLLKEKEIVSEFYNPLALSTYGDQLKLECILFELLLEAVKNTEKGGALDLWCRQHRRGEEVLELWVSNQGLMNVENIANSLTERSPNRIMKVCSYLLRTFGGDLKLFNLDRGGFLSRMSMPLASV